MKKIALPVIAILLLLTGCIGAMKPYARDTPMVDVDRTVGVGDVFFDHEDGINADDPFMGRISVGGFKFDLTVLELTNERIGFQYNEYFCNPSSGNPLSPFGTYPQPRWMVKQGFNKRFDYAIADKIIRFKGYEFEILGVDKGQLKYRRINGKRGVTSGH